ncbi:hypothetical protein RF11_11264 [Thelohanellus kitauei]|uniref:Uncharacterized protein n=1 Tax=Thelohanellus kitauei TaxID=669202 RepID=A0A0C2MA30_THEKT|nr:hypothetical protein RF11_11264 [Thelohanellus kitauei]
MLQVICKLKYEQTKRIQSGYGIHPAKKLLMILKTYYPQIIILAHIDDSLPTIVSTAPSMMGIRAVLLQNNTEGWIVQSYMHQEQSRKRRNGIQSMTGKV